MKTLYLECNMGAAGDMLMAALIELLPTVSERNQFVERLNSLGIPGVNILVSPSEKCGITGTHVLVTVNGESEEEDSPDNHHSIHDHHNVHDHNSGNSHHHDVVTDNHHHGEGIKEIEHLISGHLSLPDKVRKDVLAVYRILAEAESLVHNEPVDQIHFSEVGTMDAVADIVGVCMLIGELAPDRIVASPVHVGSGQVRCAHGMLPVPAPATALILRNIPIYGGKISGELCTPTGAALLKHFATKFGDMPVMSVAAIGYGMGTKDFESANCLRAFWGDAAATSVIELAGEKLDETCAAYEICCNLDDMTPEAIGFAQEVLFEKGALDVYTVPIGMKKSRPGVVLCCICSAENKDTLTAAFLRHTTTLGVRIQKFSRVVMDRSQTVKETPYGPVRIKMASTGDISKSKPEYEDMVKIAKEKDLTLSDVMNMLE